MQQLHNQYQLTKSCLKNLIEEEFFKISKTTQKFNNLRLKSDKVGSDF